MPSFTIGDTTVDDRSAPYVVAEIGVNHEGSMESAKRLIELAAQGGADAAKFQSYKAEALASKDSPAYWDTSKERTTSQYELFKKYDSFGPEAYAELADHCQRVGIDFLSTPFDLDAVDYLAPLVPCFKVASADLTNVPLLRAIATHGKGVLLSTGASTVAEIDAAVHQLRGGGCPAVALLHCISSYPTVSADAHLSMIEGLREAFPELVVGYSDHTLPDAQLTALTTAYLLGARVLEKHFTHDKTLPGNDHYHAMDVDDLSRFSSNLRSVRSLLGSTVQKQPVASEEEARLYARRSIVLDQDVAADTVLTATMLVCKRPGTGISPLEWDRVVGQRALRPLRADHLLQWEDLAGAGRNHDPSGRPRA